VSDGRKELRRKNVPKMVRESVHILCAAAEAGRSPENLEMDARQVFHDVRRLCLAFDIDLTNYGCPVCGLVDDAWDCWQCGEDVPKSAMIHASARSPHGKKALREGSVHFVAFCPDCGRCGCSIEDVEAEQEKGPHDA